MSRDRKAKYYLSIHPSIHLPNYLSNLHIYLWLYSPLSCLGRLFGFLIPFKVGSTPWTRDEHVVRPLLTQRTQTQTKRSQTSMPWVGFEPTIPAFVRAKAVHALDRATTAIGTLISNNIVNSCLRREVDTEQWGPVVSTAPWAVSVWRKWKRESRS
jgi:hypothetical protein